jgi:hypothetical protein
MKVEVYASDRISDATHASKHQCERLPARCFELMSLNLRGQVDLDLLRPPQHLCSWMKK